MGSVAIPPGAAPAEMRDLRSSLTVDLAQDGMVLSDADDDALDAGANLALAGEELIQFGRATQLTARCWRLDRLLRGRLGTEDAIGSQGAGDRFVMIERDAIVTIDLPAGATGATVRVLASGVGDVDGPAEATCDLTGRSLRPPSPVHVSVVAGDDDAVVGWTRRSRLGWRWTDGTDAPIGEERESYRVTVSPATGPSREIVIDQPALVVPAADRAGGPVIVTVRQSGTNAESAAVTAVVPEL